MKVKLIMAATAAFLIVSTSLADARHRHHGGYGLNCGRYMSQLLGVESTPLARDYARKFTHVAAGPGAVVVQSRRGMDSSGRHRGGHVSRIVSMISNCRAVVEDNRGTYERNICKNLIAYVQP